VLKHSSIRIREQFKSELERLMRLELSKIYSSKIRSLGSTYFPTNEDAIKLSSKNDSIRDQAKEASQLHNNGLFHHAD
jgi:hypothetical protein